MLGIVFTTTDEASVLADLVPEARFDDLQEGTPIQLDDVLIAVTGHGKIKATLATERVLTSYNLSALLHAGTCSALDEGIDVGTLVGASFVLEGDRVELDSPVYPRMPLECPFDVDTEGTLVSQDHLANDSDDESYWERLADVRDDTGYPVAYVAAQHGTPCYIVKAVGGHRDNGSQDHDGSEDARSALRSFLKTVLEDGVPQ